MAIGISIVEGRVRFRDYEFDLINTEASFKEWQGMIRDSRAVCLDVETVPHTPDKPHGSWDKLIGVAVSVCTEPGSENPIHMRAGYIPIEHNSGNTVNVGRVRLFLHTALGSGDRKWVLGHNINYDLCVMRRYGIFPENYADIDDTLIIGRLLEPEKKVKMGLDNLVIRELKGYQSLSYSEVVDKSHGFNALTDPPIGDVVAYASEDVVNTGLVFRKLSNRINKKHKLNCLYKSVEKPLIPIVSKMCSNGISVDTDKILSIKDEVEDKKNYLQELIDNEYGGHIKVNSSKDAPKFLYDHCGYPENDNPFSGKPRSTDKRAIDRMIVLDPEDPRPRWIQEWRHLDGIRSRTLDIILAGVNKDTGRIYPQFKQTGADTGRFTCSNPNLQQIPARDEIGQKCRDSFIAPEGRALVVVDFSQIEYRILAGLSGEERLIEAFKNGRDLHKMTASLALGIKEEDVTKKQRALGKKLNFASVYGQGSNSLAIDLGCSLDDAKTFLGNYWKGLPAVSQLKYRVNYDCLNDLEVHTPYGRLRGLKDIRSPEGWKKAYAKRQAMNFLIQGTAADIMKLAMLSVDYVLRSKNLKDPRLLLTVHDELVYEVDEDDAKDALSMVEFAMRNASNPDWLKDIRIDVPHADIGVPMEVEGGIGKTWGSAK